MADPQGLFDILSGAAGAPVDRPRLDAFVANAQASNGLRTAQTENALLTAQRSTEEAQARQGINQHFINSGLAPSDAQLATDMIVAGAGNASQVMDMLKTKGQDVIPNYTLGDPSQIGTPAAVAAAQARTGRTADPYTTVPNDSVPTPGYPANAAPPASAASLNPSAQAAADAQEALAGLHNVQTAAGGWNPHAAGAGVGLTDPTDIAAINKAMSEGRLSPDRVNSRTAPVFAALERANGGTINYNAVAATAAMQKNVGFQTKDIGIEAMPTLLQNVTTLGKKLDNGEGYSDNRTVGRMQQWWNQEWNDPAYTQYMGVRNDALLKIAQLMRGVGMSDQAHRAETEVATPTLSPLALDAWFKGQMQTLQPTYDAYHKIHNTGNDAAAANLRAITARPPGTPGAPPGVGLAPPGSGGDATPNNPLDRNIPADAPNPDDNLPAGGGPGAAAADPIAALRVAAAAELARRAKLTGAQ